MGKKEQRNITTLATNFASTRWGTINLNFCLYFKSHCTQQWSFPLKISSVNVAKSGKNGGFGHICLRNP